MEHLLDFLPKQRTQMIKTQLLFACGSLSRHVNAQVVTHRVTGCKRRTYRGPHESTEASSTLVLPKTEPGSRSFEMCKPRGQVWGRKGSWGRKKKKKKKGIGGNAGLHWPELHSDPPRAITGCGWLNNGRPKGVHILPPRPVKMLSNKAKAVL